MKIILCYDTHQQSDQVKYDYEYQGHVLHITEGDNDYMHRVATLTDEPRYIRLDAVPLYRFVSSLCWKCKAPVYLGMVTGFGYENGDALDGRRFDRATGYQIPTNLFEPTCLDQEVALGLYREGKSADSPFYGFLTNFKIMEIAIGRPHAVVKWIDSNIARVRNNKLRIQELNDVNNIGKTVLDIRNGIAHAFGHKQLVDVDGFPHLRDLNILRLMLEELVERVLVEILGFHD